MSDNNEKFSLIFGPGWLFIVLGGGLFAIFFALQLIFPEKFNEISNAWSISSFQIIPQMVKLSFYLFSFGFVLNYSIPRITNVVSNSVRNSIKAELIPDLKKIKKNLQTDLIAIKKKSIPLLLKNTDKNFKQTALKETLDATYGKWHNTELGYLNNCLQMIEHGVREPIYRENNIKDIKITVIEGEKKYLNWKENNSYTLKVDPRHLSNDQEKTIRYKVPFFSSLTIKNDDEEIKRTYLENFKFSIEVEREKDGSGLETLLTIDGSSFEILDGQLAVKSDKKEILEVKNEVQGSKVTITLTLNFYLDIQTESTFVCINEDSFLDITDNIYTLRTKDPFLGGRIIFEVPQQYNISHYSLCPSSRWRPVSMTEGKDGDTVRKLSTDTSRWVLPGMYFIAKWEEYSENS